MKRVSLSCLAVLALFVPAMPAQAAPEWKCPQWHDAFRKHGLPVRVFDHIAWRESRCNARSVSAPNGNGTIDIGLVQINSSWLTLTARTCKRPARQVVRSLTDPSCNLKVARILWADGKGASNWRVSSGK